MNRHCAVLLFTLFAHAPMQAFTYNVPDNQSDDTPPPALQRKEVDNRGTYAAAAGVMIAGILLAYWTWKKLHVPEQQETTPKEIR
jgi:hypothetical protein